MVIELVKIKNRMKVDLKDLITRPLGEKFYKEVGKILKNASPNEVILMNFDGIEVADPSFLDEFLVKIIMDSKKTEKTFYVKLSNFSRLTSLNLKSVLDSYSRFKNERIAVATNQLVDNDRYCIGNVDNIEKSILNYLHVNKSGNAKEISDYIGYPLDETEKILKELDTVRLIRADESGQHHYFGI
ncbi:MAG: DUF4325 domain-containing protein [Spirochaetes bacterium]|nr:DUF4325 domain-containing protein [Spirochaetota bacterium]